MPYYELICTKHGKQVRYSPKPVKVEISFCPICGRPARRNWREKKGFEPFKSYWSEALCEDPKGAVFVDSREKERELCKKLNCVRVS